MSGDLPKKYRDRLIWRQVYRVEVGWVHPSSSELAWTCDSSSVLNITIEMQIKSIDKN